MVAAAGVDPGQGIEDLRVGGLQRPGLLSVGQGFVQVALGMDNGRRGDHEKALPFSELAVALQPESPILRYHHGSILASLGRNDEAKKALRAALLPAVDFQGSSEARELLGRLSGDAETQTKPAPKPTH